MKFSCSALIILSIAVCCYSEVVEISKIDDFLSFREQKFPQLVYYFHKQPGLILQIMHIVSTNWEEESVVPYIKLGVVNCKIEGLDKRQCKACSSHKSVLMAYFNEKEEALEIKYLFDAVAFEAHLLYLLYRDQLSIINNLDYWKIYISQAKREKDVVFVYFTALGSSSHYNFMKFVHKQIDAYKIAFTNDEIFAQEMGMPSNHQVCVWYARCSKTSHSSDCPVFKQSFIGDLKYSSLTLFINFYDTPLVSEINDGSTISNQINLLLFFFDNDKSKMDLSDTIGSVITSLLHLDVRAVLVDKRKNPELFESYGIHENMILPTVMLQYPLESVKTEHKGITKIVDLFPIGVKLVHESLYKFVHDSISKPPVYNQMYDIELHLFEKLLISRNSLTNKNQRVLIGGCTKHPNCMKTCALFKSNFKRLVRTVYLDGSIIMQYKYIEYIDEPNSYMILPLLHFYDPVTGMHEFSHIDVTYLNMLLWLNLELGSAIKPIPFSRSDFVKFNFHSEYVKDLHLTQDDEVSQSVLQLKKERLYKDSVELLTDISFNNTISSYDFVVVLFFVLWDERSYLIQPHYAKVHSMMAEIHAVKMVKVDCASEYHVCTFQKVYSYPTIQLFRKGQRLIGYNGFFDAIRLEQIIKQHASAPLIELKESELHYYIESTQQRFHSTYASVSVLGWFSSRKTEAFNDYATFAENNIDKARFVFSIGDRAKEILNISSNDFFFAVYNKFNKGQPVSTFTGQYTKDSLNMFMKRMLIEAFGKLTPKNLPAYKLLEKPLLVLFIKENEKENSLVWNAIEQMVKNNLFKSVVPVWMNTEDALSRKIRTSYIGLQKHNSVDLVIVNHTKGEVYYLPTSTIADEGVLFQEIDLWLKSLESGKLNPTSLLMERHWKPLSESIDFDHDIQKKPSVRHQISKIMYFGDNVDDDTDFNIYNSVKSSSTEKDFRSPHQHYSIHDEL